MSTKIPTLKFYIDYQEDFRYVLGRITHLDPAGIDYRVKQKGMDPEEIKKVLLAKSDQEKNELLDAYMKNVYKNIQKDLESTRDTYNAIWERKSELFFTNINKLMNNIDWKFNDYHFLVSSFYSKASWGTSNWLAVWWKRDPNLKHYMNGYELVLTHFFETIDILYNRRPIPDDKLWAIAEITAYFYVYREESIVNNLWPWLREDTSKETAYDHFYNGSYRQLGKPAEELFQIYEKRLAYPEYVKNSIECINKYSVEYLNNPLV